MPGADLFVICKKCGSEVSPYVTECPYCGTRLRKRAPKLDRPDRPPKRSRIPTPRLSPLRSGEIPGIRADGRPWVTIAIVVASLGVSLAWKIVPSSLDIAINGAPGDEFWRVFTAPFLYENVGYGFIALVAIAIFGWLLERRHGPIVTALVFVCCASGGIAIASLLPDPLAAGGNGGALGLIAAWAVPSLMARRGSRGRVRPAHAGGRDVGQLAGRDRRRRDRVGPWRASRTPQSRGRLGHSRRPWLGPRGSPCPARLHPCVPTQERRAMA